MLLKIQKVVSLLALAIGIIFLFLAFCMLAFGAIIQANDVEATLTANELLAAGQNVELPNRQSAKEASLFLIKSGAFLGGFGMIIIISSNWWRRKIKKSEKVERVVMFDHPMRPPPSRLFRAL
ncbi:MAG: hypothetical protein AAB392_02435 [Patescibacteria group bacterium]